MLDTTRRKVIVGLILIAEAVFIFLGVKHWQEQEFLNDFVSGTENVLGWSPLFILDPSFTSSGESIPNMGAISAVSTGEISSIDLKDSLRESVARAQILEIITLDKRGNPKRLKVVVQMSPHNDSERNIIPWVVEQAANLRSIEITKGGVTQSEDVLRQVFSKGFELTFVITTDLERSVFKKSVPEYLSYAKEYYGNSLPRLENFLNGGLVGSYSRPILVLDVQP